MKTELIQIIEKTIKNQMEEITKNLEFKPFSEGQKLALLSILDPKNWKQEVIKDLKEVLNNLENS